MTHQNNMKHYILKAGMLMALLAAAGCATRNQTGVTTEQVDRMIAIQEQSLDIISNLIKSPSSTPAAPVTTAPVAAPASAAAPVAATSQPAVGRLRSVGSDTMDRLMEFWKTDFNKTYPRVAFYHQGRGSSTAVPALVDGKADFGPMSRKIKDTEVEHFKKKFGYEPVQARVAVDAVAVYVHPDNPFARQGMTFKQLQSIFAAGEGQVKTWGDLGLSGEWAEAPINAYGRNSASGTHSFFRKTVLGKEAEYAASVKALPGSEQLVKTISTDRFGIGYSGIGYLNDTVAAIPLSVENAKNVFPPEMQYAYSGEYPLARFLYLTVNRDPNAQLPEIPREFLTYVFSDEGQQKVTQDGFFPVSSKIIREEKTRLGI